MTVPGAERKPLPGPRALRNQELGQSTQEAPPSRLWKALLPRQSPTHYQSQQRRGVSPPRLRKRRRQLLSWRHSLGSGAEGDTKPGPASLRPRKAAQPVPKCGSNQKPAPQKDALRQGRKLLPHEVGHPSSAVPSGAGELEHGSPLRAYLTLLQPCGGLRVAALLGFEARCWGGGSSSPRCRS